MPSLARSVSFWKGLLISVFLLCAVAFLWFVLPRQIAAQKLAKERAGMAFILERGCQDVTVRERQSGTIQAIDRTHNILYVENAHLQTNPFRTDYLDMVLPVTTGSVLKDANGSSIVFAQLQVGNDVTIESDCSFIADLFTLHPDGSHSPLSLQRLIFQAVEITRQ